MIYLLHSRHSATKLPPAGLPWIYLGSSYREVSQWRARLGSANQIPMGELLADAEDRLRAGHLAWLSRQRVRSGDGLAWWLNWLQSRNTMVSSFFPDLCAISAVVSLSRDNPGPLVIVCGDRSLLAALQLNLKGQGRMAVFLSRAWHDELRAFGRNLARAGLAWLRALAEIGRLHFAARATRAASRASASEAPLPRHTVLIRSCIDRLNLDANGRLAERYYTELPGRLEANGNHVTILPWLYNFSGSLAEAYAAFRRMRGPDCLIIEDYIRLADYFRAAMALLEGVAILGRIDDHDGIGIHRLARREQWLLLSSAELLRHIAVGYGLERWLASGGHCDVWVDMFENMPPERPAMAAFRRRAPDTLLIGYMHTLTTKAFLGYHFHPSEWSSTWLPDRIVVNGPLATGLYCAQGVPAERLRSGPALRLAAQLASPAMPDPGAFTSLRRNLLVVLPMTADSAAELAAMVFEATTAIADEGLRVLVKRHPMCRADELAEQSDVLRNLPDRWSWEARELVACLPDMDVCAVGMTGAVLDIALSGTPLVYVKRDVGPAGDYSILLGRDWKMARGVASGDLASRLRELLMYREEAYREAREMARCLRAGFGSLDQTTMAAFLP